MKLDNKIGRSLKKASPHHSDMYWSRWRCGNRGSGCQGNPESG